MVKVITDDEAKRRIASNVSRLRGERTQYWLAHRIGVAPIQLSRIERGIQMPGAGTLARIAEALEVSIDSLIQAPPKNSRRAG